MTQCDALTRDLIARYDESLEAVIAELSRASGAPILSDDMRDTLKFTIVREHIHKTFQVARYGTPPARVPGVVTTPVSATALESGEARDGPAIIQSLIEPIDADIQKHLASPGSSRSLKALDALARDLIARHDESLEAMIEEMLKATRGVSLSDDKRAALKYTIVREQINKMLLAGIYGTPAARGPAVLATPASATKTPHP